MQKEISDLKCIVTEVDLDHISILIDDYKYYQIPIDIFDDEKSIKTKIYNQLEIYLNEKDNDFKLISDIPIKPNTIINTEKLYSEICSIKMNHDNEKLHSCSEIREHFQPSFSEYIDALYQKEINNNTEKYDMIMKTMSLSYELLPETLGNQITENKIEELLNGL